MGFLDNLSDKLTAGGAKVAEKAKEVSGIATLTASIEKDKVAVDKLYTEIGKKFFEQYKDELAAKFPEEVGKIAEIVEKMEASRASLRDLKGIQICPGCGKEVDKTVKFCPACGAVIPEAAPAEAPTTEE